MHKISLELSVKYCHPVKLIGPMSERRKTFSVYVNPTSVRSVLLGSALNLSTLSGAPKGRVFTHKTQAYMLEPRISLAAVVVSFWCTYHSARLQQREAAVVILSGENDSLRTCIYTFTLLQFKSHRNAYPRLIPKYFPSRTF